MTTSKFLQYISYEKRYSQNTAKAYQNDLCAFEEYAQINFNINELNTIEPDHIRSWVVNLIDSGINARSVNRKVSTLKSYYRYLLKEGLIELNPTTSIKSLKTEKKLPSYIENEQLNDLLSEDFDATNFTEVRDKLIIEVLYSTGLRRAELIGLKDDAIDLTNGILKTVGKRNKERIIPLSKQLASLIHLYIELKKTTFKNPAPYLFVTDKGNQLYPNFVLRIVKHQLMSIKGNKKSPHILRHTFATHMLNNGAELNTIKELLGHANLSATQVYTHNTIEKLKSIYIDAHPRAKLKKGG